MHTKAKAGNSEVGSTVVGTEKYKQTHSVGKRLGKGRKCKLSSTTESNMMNKTKSGKYAPAAMRGYSLNKKNTVSEITVHRTQGEKD